MKLGCWIIHVSFHILILPSESVLILILPSESVLSDSCFAMYVNK